MMERIFKLIVHVPLSHAEAVRKALGDAGAGVVGNYSHCSFTSKGVGRFRPLAGANPTIGEVGTLEEVEEEAIEVGWIPENVLVDIVNAARAVHPYEEPGIEVFEMVRI